MRALDVLVRKNAEAAGREYGHAFADGDLMYRAIEAAREETDEDLDGQDEFLAFERGVVRGVER